MSSDRFVIHEVLDNTIKRLMARKGVRSVTLMDFDGLPLRSSLDTRNAEIIAAQVSALIKKAQTLQDSIKQGKLLSIFIEMPKSELIITPDMEAGFTIVVLRDKGTK